MQTKLDRIIFSKPVIITTMVALWVMLILGAMQGLANIMCR